MPGATRDRQSHIGPARRPGLKLWRGAALADPTARGTGRTAQAARRRLRARAMSARRARLRTTPRRSRHRSKRILAHRVRCVP
ncbi:BTAD domain-containing putative transcriptional regulator [Novosphingobium sp. Fuku2-ISO-50]|uniref:BTAD domain-containing putative transcriptional regulator n=1 Tax=Novosphingobium sp. Fuku2-ISO-50 TaxID=1739114 RepID=UPI0012E3F91F